VRSLREERILVTGATGFIGRHLVEKLHSEGTEVYALVRRRMQRSEIQASFPSTSGILYGDITDYSEMVNAFKQGEISIVIHLAATVEGPETRASRRTYFKTNVDGTLNVCKACLASGVKRLIHLSTVAVHGPADAGELIDESCPYAPTTDYETSKAIADRLVLDFAKKGLCTTVLRPTLVYGYRLSPVFKWLFRYVGARFVPVLGDGLALKHFVHINDLLECISLAIDHGPSGKAYIVADETPVTVDSLLLCIASILNRDATLIHIPVPRHLLSTLSRHIPGRLAYPMSWFLNCRAYRTDLARRELGYCPKVELRKGLEELLNTRRASWNPVCNVLV